MGSESDAQSQAAIPSRAIWSDSRGAARRKRGRSAASEDPLGVGSLLMKQELKQGHRRQYANEAENGRDEMQA